MTRFVAAVAVALAVLAPAGAIAAPAAEVRFCPAGVARTYPLDSLRGVQSLNLQNVAVLNTGAEPVEIAALDIDLLRAGQVIDRRTLSDTLLASAVRGAQAAKAQGLMDVMAFQTCDGRLLSKSALAESPTLGSGQALLVMQQVFAWKGVRDELRVTARGKAGEAIATGAVKLDGATSKTHFRWPLKSGAWLAGTASSFHTTHRWAVPEEFALDIARIGADGRTFRTNGEKHTDFYAYDAEVVAAADGVVAGLVTGAKEAPPMLPKPGEALDAYYGRIGAQQAINLAAGPPGVVGEAVILDHGGGEYSIYAHLRPGSITVKTGQRVAAGTTLGRLGSSGNSTEAHLHFQVCDQPSAVSCAGLIPTFDGLTIANADGPRPIQSGDIIRVP
jgi:murein DD-endopeptidase MepM/ murein hydrolase activator NlpD